MLLRIRTDNPKAPCHTFTLNLSSYCTCGCKKQCLPAIETHGSWIEEGCGLGGFTHYTFLGIRFDNSEVVEQKSLKIHRRITPKSKFSLRRQARWAPKKESSLGFSRATRKTSHQSSQSFSIPGTGWVCKMLGHPYMSRRRSCIPVCSVQRKVGFTGMQPEHNSRIWSKSVDESIKVTVYSQRDLGPSFQAESWLLILQN